MSKNAKEQETHRRRRRLSRSWEGELIQERIPVHICHQVVPILGGTCTRSSPTSTTNQEQAEANARKVNNEYSVQTEKTNTTTNGLTWSS